MLLSYSQIQLYARCPKQYYFAYIEKISQPRHKSLSFGTSIHSTLYVFFHAYQHATTLPLQGDLFEEARTLPDLSFLLECLDKSWISTGYDSSKEMYEKKQYAINLLTDFYYQEIGCPTILFLEKSFSIPIGNHRVKGRFDRVDYKDQHSLEVIDYKTGKLRSQEDSKDDLQLQLYGIALAHLFPEKNVYLTLHFVEHKQKVRVDISKKREEAIKNMVINIGNSIDAGIFEASPEPLKCSYCPYSRICPQAYAQ